MNRIILILLLPLILCSYMFCDSILIVPFTVYDQNSMTVKLEEKPEETVYKTLRLYEFGGLLNFKFEGNRYPAVYTSIDANKVCNVSNSDYVLYGYIQKNENSWYGNIKLYDFAKKKIIKEFFASDDIASYERFIAVLGNNVVAGLEEISGYSHIEKDGIEYRLFKLEAGGNILYWTPLSAGWIDTVTGVGGIQGDLRLFFPHERLFIKSTEIDFSLNFRLSYSYGCGKQNMYPLNFHILKINMPAFIYMKIDRNNTVYVGTGPSCEFDFLDIIERHSNRKLYYQNIFGLEGILGYEFNVTPDIKIFFETTADFHFNSDSYVSLRPGIGAVIKIYGGGK